MIRLVYPENARMIRGAEPLCAIFRRHSIDELPQVVNVLTGPGRLASSEVTGSTDRMRELERGIHFALLWRHRGDRIKRMLRSKI